MNPDETVLSEVHVYANGGATRFEYFAPLCDNSDHEENGVDQDNDLLVRRRSSNHVLNAIWIEHSELATPLAVVGLQVWPAALLMCDFLLEMVSRDTPVPNGIVDLGSGVGLCGLMAGYWTRNVFMTDYSDDILRLCARNVDRNKEEFSDVRYAVKRLDWRTWPQCRWTENEDVIYSEDLTSAFVDTLIALCEGSRKVVYVALEKRLNFVLSEMEVACPAYKHFQSLITELLEKQRKWTVTLIDVEGISQRMRGYSRSQYMELWKLESPLTS